MARNNLHLLLLPREMRDHIYHWYLLEDGADGYHFNFQTGKFRTASKKPIDLRLMYTCGRIADEMRGLALRTHTLTFKTVCSPRAPDWDRAIKTHRLQMETLMEAVVPIMDDCNYLGLLTDDERFARYGNGKAKRFQSNSAHHETQRELLRNLAAADPAIEGFIYMAYWTGSKQGNNYDADPLRFLDIGREPWKIPSRDELDLILHRTCALGMSLQNYSFHWAMLAICCFSAASVAISFLNSAPSDTIQHIQKIVLNEDRYSAAHSETHLQGLIQFCSKNPKVQIERRVDLWRTLWAPLVVYNPRYSDTADYKRLTDATRLVADWINEAPAFPPNVTLVIDGGKIPEHASRLFQEVVHYDAAFQTAFERVFRQPETSLDAFRKRPVQPCFGEQFPALLKAMCSNESSSRVRCNFDPGQPWDEAQIAEIMGKNGRNRSRGAWIEKWVESRRTLEEAQTVIETVAPLSPLCQLFRDQESVYEDVAIADASPDAKKIMDETGLTLATVLEVMAFPE